MQKNTVAAFLVLLFLACASPPGQSAPDSGMTSAPAKVQTLVAQTEPVARQVALTGSLKANAESDVAANASGQVVRTFVERGTAVRKGEALVRLDARSAVASAAEARANLEGSRLQKSLSESQCDRNRKLYERHVITQEEHDRTDSGCRQQDQSLLAQEARVRQVEVTLSNQIVRAPFDGVVDVRHVGVGEYVQAGSPIARLVQTDPLRLELTAGEAEAGAIQAGQPVMFQVKAMGERTWRATVRYVAPALRSATRDLVFEAVADNPDGTLKPGMFVTASIDVGKEDRVVLPASAIRRDGDDLRVFVVVDSHLEERVVQAGASTVDGVVIRKGVENGETVVARDVESLKDGQAVE